MNSTLYDREVVRCSSTRHVLWRSPSMLRNITKRSLRPSGSCWALTTAGTQGLNVLMPQTLLDVIQKANVQDEFSVIEMASEAKQKVGGRVMGRALNLGEFVTRVNLYVTTLGPYNVVIGMDWLGTHEAILNCKTKRLSLVDDEG
jgi:hypothetical protein